LIVLEIQSPMYDLRHHLDYSKVGITDKEVGQTYFLYIHPLQILLGALLWQDVNPFVRQTNLKGT